MYWTGRFTFAGTGSQTITVGTFQPTGAKVTIGGKNAGDAFTHMSIGQTDGTRQNVQYTYGDTTGSSSGTSNTKIISHYERVSGVITEVFSAAFTSFGTSGANGTVTFSVTTNDTAYEPTIEVWA